MATRVTIYPSVARPSSFSLGPTLDSFGMSRNYPVTRSYLVAQSAARASQGAECRKGLL